MTGVQEMADRIAALMEERLGVRGATLDEKLRRGGRLLPREIREEAAFLAECAEMAEHPALFARLDHARAAQAHDRCRRHLRRVGLWKRRGDAVLRMSAQLAWILLVGSGLVLGLAWWRGLI